MPPPPTGDAFGTLARSISHQQLAGRAAAAIHGRFVALFGDDPPTPAAVVATPVETLRACGLSGAKVTAIRDLAARFLDGTVPEAQLASLSNDEVVARLTVVRGVGRWTAEMFLLFDLGRPDVWPVDDFGVRKGWSASTSRWTCPRRGSSAPWVTHFGRTGPRPRGTAGGPWILPRRDGLGRPRPLRRPGQGHLPGGPRRRHPAGEPHRRGVAAPEEQRGARRHSREVFEAGEGHRGGRRRGATSYRTVAHASRQQQAAHPAEDGCKCEEQDRQGLSAVRRDQPGDGRDGRGTPGQQGGNQPANHAGILGSGRSDVSPCARPASGREQPRPARPNGLARLSARKYPTLQTVRRRRKLCALTERAAGSE